jgi:hypothetical protein
MSDCTTVVSNDKTDGVVFRRALDGSKADRFLEAPAWMFDRTACPEEPFVSMESPCSAVRLAHLFV